MAESLLTLLLAIALPVLMGLLIAMLSELGAKYAYRAHQRDFDRYLKREQEFRQLQDRFIDESWYWPIKVRPVLYLEVDRWAQIRFANAQWTIAQAEETQIEIYPIPSPKSEPEKRFRPIIYAGVIKQYFQVHLQLKAFERLIREGWNLLKELQGDHQQVEELQTQVRAKIERLAEKLDRLNEKFQTINVSQAPTTSRFRWSFENAQNCLILAEKQFETVGNSPSEDGLEYAIADTLHATAEYFVEYFELKNLVIKHYLRYELDQINHLLELAERLLQIILRDQVIQSWRILVNIRAKFRALQEIMRLARASYDDFEVEQATLETNLKTLKGIHFQDYIEEAKEIESKIEEYWGNYHDGEAYWKEFLGEVLPPFQRLQDCQQQYQPIVEKVLQDGEIILQSEMSEINLNLREFKDRLESVHQEIQELRKEYQRNLDAEMKARASLAEGGESHSALAYLKAVLKDSSPEIQTVYSTLKRDFEKYRMRAASRKWANYPDLLVNLQRFVILCRDKRREHDLQIGELQSQTSQLWVDLNSIFRELRDLKDRKPKLEWDWEAVFEDHHFLEENFPSTSSNYSVLQQFIQEAHKVIENAIENKHYIEEEWNNFEYRYGLTGQSLQRARTELKKYIQELETGWPAILMLITEDLKIFREHYDQLAQSWQDVLNARTINQAFEQCNQIEIQIESVRKDARNVVLSTRTEQRKLDGIYRAIKQDLEKFQNKLSQEDRDNIEYHVNEARKGLYIDESRSHLFSAHDLIKEVVGGKRYVDSRTIVDARQTIDHSTRINTGNISEVSGGQINIGGRDILPGQKNIDQDE
jgi:chromosome segregation ATPase